MPQLPHDLKGTWFENSYKNYEYDSDYSNLSKKLDGAAAFSKERNVPVFCGEFGVYMIQSPAGDRVKWYEFISTELIKRKIPRTSWDYFGGFGIFRSPYAGNFNSEINGDVVRALGFKAPRLTK
jgi:endoglucanase